MKKFLLPFVLSICLLAPLHYASAVEVLSARALAAHCQSLVEDPASPNSEFCMRYIQGFLDGAVATDARVMLNVEAELERDKGLVERALRTRMPNRAEFQRAAHYAEFCLGDPVPLNAVVAHVVADLQRPELVAKAAAREVVYQSLKTHYPCTS